MEDLRNIEITIDQDFWEDFIQEAFEHIEAIESNAIDLEDNPDNMEIIHTMFRAFHTIKGLSGFVEHTIIQEVAHATETLMDLCRKEVLRVNKDIVDAILKTADYIKNMCNDVDCYKNSDFIEGIIAHIAQLQELSNVEINTETPSESTFIQQEESEMEQPETQSQEENFDFQVNNEAPDDIQKGEPFIQPEESVNIENTEYQEAQNEDICDIVTCSEANLEELAKLDLNDIIKPEEEEEEEEENIEVAENIEQTPVETQVENKPEELTEATYVAPVIQEVKKEQPQVKPAVQNLPQTKSANDEYMKVANSRIDFLVDMIGELIINQSLLEQYIETNYAQDSKLLSNISSFASITRELQYSSMSLRMVSLRSTFSKIARIARDTIKDLGKDVEFITSGESTEIDRIVADKLLDPLVHLIKNAISHGVEEKPQDRVDAGKTRKAKVELNAYNKRGKIYIEIKDDGRGINTQAVYDKALEKGLISPNVTYSAADINEFIFLPGFSTAKVVDNISGRGVGMDVVKTQIQKIGGKVEIASEPNVGSTFTLEVPVNHAIMNGTVIDINSNQFIIPTINVKEIIQVHEDQWITTHGKLTMVKVREDVIQVVPPSTILSDVKDEDNKNLVVLLALDQELRALPITNVVNRQEIVVKPAGLEFSNLKYIAGMSILGNGQVSLILDTDYLFKKEMNE